MNDLYTRTVLSIIAASLLALVAQNAIHPSQAQLSTDVSEKVQICDTRHCADFTHCQYSSVLGRTDHKELIR